MVKFDRKIIELPIRELGIDKFNVRKGEYSTDEDLEGSIKQMGIMYPLLVRPAKGKKKYSIICGGRRYHAGLAAGLKTAPCVVQELTDLEALGLSLQENLQRGNLDAVQIADAVADMWELINHGTSEKDKMARIHKEFGFGKAQVYNYLAISRLSDKIKGMIVGRAQRDEPSIDTDTAADIAHEDLWKPREQEQVAKIAAEEPSSEKRRKLVGAMRTYAGKLTPAEAYEKVKGIRQGRYYTVYLNAQVCEAMDEAQKKLNLDAAAILEKAITEFLKKKGWL